MSTGTPPPSSTAPTRAQEILLISHSNLFYWWPVWFLAFFMALWTLVENHRIAIVPSGVTVAAVSNESNTSKSYILTMPPDTPSASLERAVQVAGSSDPAFPTRVSEHPALGAVFMIGLILTIVITNVPLRGLWSFLTIIMVIVLALIVTVFRAWDQIFDMFTALRIHMNMAAYLFIGSAVLVLWTLAAFVFDRRSYIIFTPGQIRVCEHIGASVEAFGTAGVRLEKQRDDLFRHYILGFGSGDLIVHTPDGRQIKMPN
ncbi:MAG: hypothetical protein ACRC7O_09315, partial [Fimbriiglobus sp.]